MARVTLSNITWQSPPLSSELGCSAVSTQAGVSLVAQSSPGVSVSGSFLQQFYFVFELYPQSVAPALVKHGLAFGKAASDEYPLVTYLSLSFKDPSLYVTQPSVRYWLLWPGVLIMLAYSFADVAFTLVPLFKRKKISFLFLFSTHINYRTEGCKRQP